jgi:predicted nucleic acid-binding Zn ribbon protein
MPVYVYEIIQPDDAPGPTFEIVQRISDKPLTVHPETGEAIRRVIQPPFIGGTWSDGSMGKKMKDEKKLGQQGFTKYVKAGDGIYEKRCGKGPDVISRDSQADSSSFGHLD